MSRSNLNIKDLEKRFDELLYSFSDKDIETWIRFDKTQEELELFYSGHFQPVAVSEFTTTVPAKEALELNDIEVFDYTLDIAC